LPQFDFYMPKKHGKIKDLLIYAIILDDLGHRGM
jgi:hypothetical protein